MTELQLDGYIRVSRVGGRDGDSFISPDVQRDQIETWARLRGVTIAEWHTDLDASGGTMARPGLDALLARVRDGSTGGIAVARLDRLSRASVVDALKVVAEIHDAGGQVAAVDLGIDPTTAFGEFAMTIMLALARMERRRIAEQWRISRQRAVERGIHVASGTPTGYSRGGDGRLVRHPQHASVVRRLFELRAGGASWSELDGHLEDAGVVGPYGPLNTGSRTARHIVTNRVYLGEARSGEYVNPAAHEPLVDRTLWEAANRARSVSPPRGEPALLSGILRCAGCRHPMKPDKMLTAGERVRTYRCRIHHAGGRCEDRAAVLGRVIEPYVEELVLRNHGETHAHSRQRSSEMQAMLAERDEAERVLVTYRDDARILAALGADRYLEGLRPLVGRVEELDERLARLAAELGRPGLSEEDLRALWPEMATAQRRKIIAGAVDAVMLRSGRQLPIGDRTLVLWQGQLPDDFPRRGRTRQAVRPFAWPADHPVDAGPDLG